MMVCLHVKVVWRRSGGALQAARLPGPHPGWMAGSAFHPTNWFYLVFNGIDLSNYKAIIPAIFLVFSPRFNTVQRLTMKPI